MLLLREGVESHPGPGSNKFLEQIKQIQKSRDFLPPKEKKTKTFSLKVGESESADEYFKRVLSNSSPADVLLEFFWFKRNLPQLTNNKMVELIEDVKKHLNVDNLTTSTGRTEMHFSGNQFPILDALSYKIGSNLRNIIAPPTTKCVLCGKNLVSNNKPVNVPLFSECGPEMATKYEWECTSCTSVYLFRSENPNNFNSTRIYYQVDQYGNPDIGYKKYKEEFNVKVIRSSSETYLSERLLKSYLSELQHCWTSAEGKAESYNETYRNSEKTEYFDNFLFFHPTVGGHFRTRANNTKDDLEEEEEVETKMHEIKRKSVTAGLFNYLILDEIKERNEIENTIFGPKIDPQDNKKKVSYKDSVNNYMKQVDEKRKGEIYQHECSENCKKRGCGKVSSIDGLWKLSYKICMWEPKPRFNVQKPIENKYPNVCPEEPENLRAFCREHSKIVENHGYPSDLRKFLEKCGANPNAYSKEGKHKVKEVLLKISRDDTDGNKTDTVEETQGVKYLLRNRKITNTENFSAIEGTTEGCRKDIGEAPRLHRRSRGVECVVGGGGVVQYWAPLYKSEGPTQVALIVIKFLQLHLAGKTVEDFRNFFLSYDNICHLDELKLFRHNLDLPAPYDKVWLEINKVIDPLHIKNHTRPKCKELYNPEKVKKQVPEANLMCAEQTFAWLGRYKRIFNSMTKTHFHFMVHCLIKGRNSYTTYCYKNKKKPLLPSAKIAKSLTV